MVNTTQKLVPVRVINMTPEPITLHRGTTMATCEEVDEVDCTNTHHVNALNANSKTELPPHLSDLLQRSCTGLSKKHRDEVVDLLNKYQNVFSKGDDDIGRTRPGRLL